MEYGENIYDQPNNRSFCEKLESAQCQNQVEFDKQILIYVYICLLPSEVSLQLKSFPKDIYKNKCREDQIDTIFNSPRLFTSNPLTPFKQPMLVYEECFQCGRVYLHFTYNGIYICYNSIKWP